MSKPVWPLQPGGYVAVLADVMVKEAALKARRPPPPKQMHLAGNGLKVWGDKKGASK